MSNLKDVFAKIDSYEDEVIALQKGLTALPALGPDNGGSGEHDKAAYMKGLLEKLRPDSIDEIRAPDTRARDGYRPNLMARWAGAPGSPTVWILSHLDIVPPGDRSLWGADPFSIRVEGERIYGRGVEDNHHGIVSSYLAVKAILEMGLHPRRGVGLALVADEETGSGFGLDYVLRNHARFFGRDDLIVVPDGGNDEGTMIETAEKSMLWLKFTLIGKQCHGSTPEKGRNTLTGAARLIVALEALNTEFGLSDPLFKPSVSTFAPTKMEANVPNVNTIPGKDVFYLDCRILPQYKLDRILEACQRISEEVGGGLGLGIRIDPVMRQEAAPPTPEDAPVVQALAGAIHRVTGREAKPMGIGGGTVAAFFRKAGFPAAVWCTAPDTAHQPDEYCLIPDLLTDAKIFACLFLPELKD
jgi:succinyl-diaminopimelate desuccinylase